MPSGPKPARESEEYDRGVRPIAIDGEGTLGRRIAAAGIDVRLFPLDGRAGGPSTSTSAENMPSPARPCPHSR